MTPLHYASTLGFLDVVSLLLAAGAPFAAQDRVSLQLQSRPSSSDEIIFESSSVGKDSSSLSLPKRACGSCFFAVSCWC
jgi:ankyrin repeat protein